MENKRICTYYGWRLDEPDPEILYFLHSVVGNEGIIDREDVLEGFKSGTISGIQNGKNGKPEWILSDGWDLRNINSSSRPSMPDLIMLNGSAPHMRTITDFNDRIAVFHLFW